MEKILTTVVTIALTCTMGFANEAESTFIPSENSRIVSYENTCSGYVDADYDGFCDNCNLHHSESDSTCLEYADFDNDGFCDNCSSHHFNTNGFCPGYVDADHDGFCDNHAHGEQCPYATADTLDNSVTDTQGYCGRHHGNGGHHGHRYH